MYELTQCQSYGRVLFASCFLTVNIIVVLKCTCDTNKTGGDSCCLGLLVVKKKNSTGYLLTMVVSDQAMINCCPADRGVRSENVYMCYSGRQLETTYFDI